MDAVSLLVILLAGYGLTFTVRSASITEAPRAYLVTRSEFLQKLFACGFCTGFWMTMAVTVLWGVPTVSIIDGVRKTLTFGLAGASFSLVVDTFQTWLEQRLL